MIFKTKSFTAALLCALILVLAAGCAAAPNPANYPVGPGSANTALNAEAKDAYIAFLDGNGKVTTSEAFNNAAREQEFYYGLPVGTYTFEQLKEAVAELEMSDSTVQYALFDFGRDGVDELALRFDSIDDSFMNWVGIIRWNGSSLELNYNYEDGYRTYSELYDTGYLNIGGSGGAGLHGFTVVGFSGTGVGRDIFTLNEYSELFANGIGYDLSKDWDAFTDGLDDPEGATKLVVREYKTDNGEIILSATGWSEDETLRAAEEAFIARLEGLGATSISDEEMDALSSLAPYEGAPVEWIEKQ